MFRQCLNFIRPLSISCSRVSPEVENRKPSGPLDALVSATLSVDGKARATKGVVVSVDASDTSSTVTFAPTSSVT